MWTREDARRVLDEAKRSGEPLAAFARGRGLGVARLYWWKKRLTTERERQSIAAPAPTLSLVPAVVTGESMVAIVVRLPGDVSIEIADANPSMVAAIAAALARSLS